MVVAGARRSLRACRCGESGVGVLPPRPLVLPLPALWVGGAGNVGTCSTGRARCIRRFGVFPQPRFFFAGMGQRGKPSTQRSTHRVTSHRVRPWHTAPLHRLYPPMSWTRPSHRRRPGVPGFDDATLRLRRPDTPLSSAPTAARVPVSTSLSYFRPRIVADCPSPRRALLVSSRHVGRLPNSPSGSTWTPQAAPKETRVELGKYPWSLRRTGRSEFYPLDLRPGGVSSMLPSCSWPRGASGTRRRICRRCEIRPVQTG